MFSDTIASNGAVCSTPHAFAHTSISTGGSTLLSLVNLIQLAVLARESASGSLGNHVRLGIASAKCTACSPVPQPISSTKRSEGRTRFRTARIGAEFRETVGENMRWSAPTPRCSSATGGRLSLSSVMVPTKSCWHDSGLSHGGPLVTELSTVRSRPNKVTIVSSGAQQSHPRYVAQDDVPRHRSIQFTNKHDFRC